MSCSFQDTLVRKDVLKKSLHQVWKHGKPFHKPEHVFKIDGVADCCLKQNNGEVNLTKYAPIRL